MEEKNYPEELCGDGSSDSGSCVCSHFRWNIWSICLRELPDLVSSYEIDKQRVEKGAALPLDES